MIQCIFASAIGASYIDNRRMRGALFIRIETVYTDSRTRYIESNNMEIDRESRVK